MPGRTTIVVQLPFFTGFSTTLNNQHDLLDPMNEKHLIALHCVYLPWINCSLKHFKEAWNCHGLCTERGKTPNQLFTAGLLRLRYSGLDAVDLFEDVSDEYGESEEGGSHNGEAVDDDQGVPVPHLSISKHQCN